MPEGCENAPVRNRTIILLASSCLLLAACGDSSGPAASESADVPAVPPTTLAYVTPTTGGPAADEVMDGVREALVGLLMEREDLERATAEERADLLTSRVEALLLNLTSMTGPANQRKMGRILEASSEMMENMSALVADNRTDLNAVVANLAVVTRNLAATTKAMQATMDSIHSLAASQDTRGALRDLRLTMSAVRAQFEGPLPELVTNLNRMAGRIDTAALHIDLTVLQSRKDILNAMAHLEETLSNVCDATELIRENPSVLIRGRSD